MHHCESHWRLSILNDSIKIYGYSDKCDKLIASFDKSGRLEGAFLPIWLSGVIFSRKKKINTPKLTRWTWHRVRWRNARSLVQCFDKNELWLWLLKRRVLKLTKLYLVIFRNLKKSWVKIVWENLLWPTIYDGGLVDLKISKKRSQFLEQTTCVNNSHQST